MTCWEILAWESVFLIYWVLFCLLLVKSSAADLKCFWPFNSKKLPSEAKTKVIHWCGLTYSLRSFKIFWHLPPNFIWTPALELQTKNTIEITRWFQKANIADLQLRSWKRSRATEGKNQALVGALPFCGEYPGSRSKDKFRSSNQMDGISIAGGGKMADS